MQGVREGWEATPSNTVKNNAVLELHALPFLSGRKVMQAGVRAAAGGMAGGRAGALGGCQGC